MNGIEVEYIDHMGDDLRVANVARVSFNNWKNQLEDKDVRLIDYLAANQHTSPFRHVFLSVRCTAPIFLARQLAKHQVGLSWNEISRRYVDSAPKFFVPDEWRSRPKGGIKQGSGDAMENQEYYKDTYAKHLLSMYRLYSELIVEGMAPEQARMLMPQSMLTQWIWSGSLQSFSHIYKLRADEHAQKEAQDFAFKLENIVCEVFPYTWSALDNN